MDQQPDHVQAYASLLMGTLFLVTAAASLMKSEWRTSLGMTNVDTAIHFAAGAALVTLGLLDLKELIISVGFSPPYPLCSAFT